MYEEIRFFLNLLVTHVFLINQVQTCSSSAKRLNQDSLPRERVGVVTLLDIAEMSPAE